MNDDEIDQLFYKLNYQSRFTLAHPHPKDITSPLLTSTYTNSIYTSRYLEASRLKRKNQQQHSITNRQSSNITIEEDDCILIEESDDLQVQLQEKQQLQNSQEQIRSFQLIDRNQDEKNWIKIQQDNEMEMNGSFIEKIVYQEPDYQQKQQRQSVSENFDRLYFEKPKNYKDVFSEKGLMMSKEFDNHPNMTRNYTFGNNLNQNAFFEVSNKTKQKHQRRQKQGLFSIIPIQCQKQPRNSRIVDLTLQEVDNENNHERISQIISPKFADLPLNQQQSQVINKSLHKNQTPKTKIKLRYKTSKKEQKHTSPKSQSSRYNSQSSKSKSHSSRSSSKKKRQSSKISNRKNQETEARKSAIFIEQSQQLSQKDKEEKQQPQILNKSRIYQQSINKIDSIINFLPNKLRNTYLEIRQELLEKQKDFKQKLQLQNKKIKVLTTLIQIQKLGPKLQEFILQSQNCLQQKIILNQIILRLSIKQLVKSNTFFHAKGQL